MFGFKWESRKVMKRRRVGFGLIITIIVIESIKLAVSILFHHFLRKPPKPKAKAATKEKSTLKYCYLARLFGKCTVF